MREHSIRGQECEPQIVEQLMAGITISEIADMFGMAHSAISRWRKSDVQRFVAIKMALNNPAELHLLCPAAFGTEWWLSRYSGHAKVEILDPEITEFRPGARALTHAEYRVRLAFARDAMLDAGLKACQSGIPAMASAGAKVILATIVADQYIEDREPQAIEAAVDAGDTDLIDGLSLLLKSS